MLFVPFHRPQEPSADQREESTASTEEEDLRSRIWGERVLAGAGCGVWTRGTPSGTGEPCRRLAREDLVGVCATGAEEVK